MDPCLFDQISSIVGTDHIVTDPDILQGRSIDYTGRYHGEAQALIRPKDTAEVSQIFKICYSHRLPVTIQGGRTSLVAGTVPQYNDLLISTERLNFISPLDASENQIRVGAGVVLADLNRYLSGSGYMFGVDLASRDSATLGGMAATNAGGLYTIGYGPMADQVTGMEVVLPDGSVMRRRSRIRRDTSGYNLPALLLGSEGTLGLITSLDVRVIPTPQYRVTALCGFVILDDLIDAVRCFARLNEVVAIELIDARTVHLLRLHADVDIPLSQEWLLLIELASNRPCHDLLLQILNDMQLGEDCVLGMDAVTRRQLWKIREGIAGILGSNTPPLKFDIALPLDKISAFIQAAHDFVQHTIPDSYAILFGHIGQENLHFNILSCPPQSADYVYTTILGYVAHYEGNVSAEHGLGSCKRSYLKLSRENQDIAAMKMIKHAFDPSGYLNPGVLFE